MARVTTVQKAQKDYPQHGIKKGDKYYWWKFRYGGKHMSKTYPKPSQLTQSEYLSTLYEIQDAISGLSGADSPENLQSSLQDIISDLENLRDDTQGKFDNMPEGLQQGDTGQLLQERIDALENAISELEGIDCEYDEESDENIMKGLVTDEEEGHVVTDEAIAEKKQELLQEWMDEKIDEAQGVSFE